MTAWAVGALTRDKKPSDMRFNAFRRISCILADISGHSFHAALGLVPMDWDRRRKIETAFADSCIHPPCTNKRSIERVPGHSWEAMGDLMARKRHTM